MDPVRNVYEQAPRKLPTRFRLGMSRVQACFGLSWILHCLVPYPLVISLWAWWPLYTCSNYWELKDWFLRWRLLKSKENCKFELLIWGLVWRGLHIAKVWWTLATIPTEAFLRTCSQLIKRVCDNCCTEFNEPRKWWNWHSFNLHVQVVFKSLTQTRTITTAAWGNWTPGLTWS